MYSTLSSPIFWLLVVTGTILMELLAWAGHKYLLHGPAWSLHKSHHDGSTSRFEGNDVIAVVFAGIAIALFAFSDWTVNFGKVVASSMTLYGILYAIVHEGLAHGRLPLPQVLVRGYVKRLVQAHRLHHTYRTQSNPIAHGFLYAQPVRVLLEKIRGYKTKLQLKQT